MQALLTSRPFMPGTTGWTAGDLDDPEIERQWMRGRYEIVEGVLTTMPAAYFSGGNAAFNLIYLIKSHLREERLPGRFSTEVDIIIDEDRVARADAVMLLPKDEAAQRKAARAAKRRDVQRTRILVPPTLVIESISPGHERHDLRTKRRWYADFGVPNYWLLDAFAQSLKCLQIDAPDYRVQANGRADDKIEVPLLPGLVIPLATVWND